MTTMPPEAGPYRDPDELSYLTPDMMMPLDPMTLAREHDAGTLHGYAMGELSIAEGLSQQAEELRGQLAILEGRIEHARNRAAAYIEAITIVKGDENAS